MKHSASRLSRVGPLASGNVATSRKAKSLSTVRCQSARRLKGGSTQRKGESERVFESAARKKFAKRFARWRKLNRHKRAIAATKLPQLHKSDSSVASKLLQGGCFKPKVPKSVTKAYRDQLSGKLRLFATGACSQF